MRKRSLSAFISFALLSMTANSDAALTSLSVTGSGMSTYSVSGIFNTNLETLVVNGYPYDSSFKNIRYEDVWAFTYSETVSFNVPQFNPSLGTLSGVRASGYVLGDVTWRYHWYPSEGTAIEYYYYGWEQGILLGVASGGISITMPGYSWSKSTSGGIPENSGGTIIFDENGDPQFVPTNPEVTGVVNLIGSDIEHQVSALQPYIGTGYVPYASMTISAGLSLDFLGNHLDWCSYAMGEVSGIIGGYVSVTYDYTTPDGAVAQLTVPATFGSIAAVPEPTTIGVLGLAFGAMFLRRKS